MNDTIEVSTATTEVRLPTTANETTGDFRTYQLADFNRVEITFRINTIIEVGKEFSIRAEATSPDTLDDLSLEVQGNKLVANSVTGFLASLFNKRDAITLYISMPELIEVEANTGAYIITSGTFGPDFSAEASTGATLLIDGITTKRARLEASTGASLQVSGSCESLYAEVAVGSSLKASKLVSQDVKVEADVGGSAKVFADYSIDAEASTGGTIKVYGSPENVNVDESIGGSVTFAN